MTRDEKPEWGSWVWIAVAVLLVGSFVIDVVGWRVASDITAALAFFTAFGGVVRMPSVWKSYFGRPAAKLLTGAFAGAFLALMIASLWSSTWGRGARITLDLTSVAVLAAFVAAMTWGHRSVPRKRDPKLGRFMRIDGSSLLLLFALAFSVAEGANIAVRTSVPLHRSTWVIKPFIYLGHIQPAHGWHGVTGDLGAVLNVANGVIAVAVVAFLYPLFPRGLWLTRAGLGISLAGSTANVFEIFAYGSVTDFIGVHLGGVGVILNGLWNIGDVEIYLGLAVAGAFYVLRGPDPIPTVRRTARRLAGGSRHKGA